MELQINGQTAVATEKEIKAALRRARRDEKMKERQLAEARQQAMAKLGHLAHLLEANPGAMSLEKPTVEVGRDDRIVVPLEVKEVRERVRVEFAADAPPAWVICDGAGWTLGVICEPTNGEPEFALAVGAVTPTVYAFATIPSYILLLVRKKVLKG